MGWDLPLQDGMDCFGSRGRGRDNGQGRSQRSVELYLLGAGLDTLWPAVVMFRELADDRVAVTPW